MICSNLRVHYALVGLSAVMGAGVGGNTATSSETTASAPPGYSTERTGSVHDFDYFAGAWTTRQHRLKVRGAGSTEWEDFPATLCMTLYLGGTATVDELYVPTRGQAGLTLRTFDSEKHQWSIYWVSGVSGKLDPVPAVGGFAGRRGEFYAADEDKGPSEPMRQEPVRAVVRGASAATRLAPA